MNTHEKTLKSIPELMKELNIKNKMALPRLKKAVINIGIGSIRDQGQKIEQLKTDLAKITGQKPVSTVASKAVSGFKVQKGQAVGIKVTLRGKRMYDFIDKILNALLPAIRDFKGIKNSSVDKFGNLNLGIKEHSLFPEIGYDNPQNTHGLQITIVPTVNDRTMAIALYKIIGIPFEKESK